MCKNPPKIFRWTLSVTMAALMTFSSCLSALALEYNGSSSSAPDSTINNPNASDYSIPYINGDAGAGKGAVIGYRFTGIDAKGQRAQDKESIDVILTTSRPYANKKGSIGYVTEKFSKLEIYNKVINGETFEITTSTTMGGNTLLDTNSSFDELDSDLPLDPEAFKPWQNTNANIDTIAKQVGFPSGLTSQDALKDLAGGEKIIVEPLYMLKLEGEYVALTVTEIAYYGLTYFVRLGYTKEKAEAQITKVDGFGNVMRYTNGYWPNFMFTPEATYSSDGTLLLPAATEIPNGYDVYGQYYPSTSGYRATIGDILRKGYGVSICYTVPEEINSYSIIYDANGGTGAPGQS